MLTDDQIIKLRTTAATHALHQTTPHPEDGFYRMDCKLIARDEGVLAILARECGLSLTEYPSPLLDRCEHLSLSFFDVDTMAPLPFNVDAARDILARLWGESRLADVWTCGPTSPDGQYRQLRHFRLFHGAAWLPIEWKLYDQPRRLEAINAAKLGGGLVPALEWFQKATAGVPA